MFFDPRSVRVGPIRDAQEYGGFRVRFEARLGQARIPLQADVGFGDVVTPAAVSVEYPTLLDHPPPRLRAYPKATVIAEKLQAMAALGMLNSPMKDFYDVWVMAETFSFDGPVLAEALRATFKRRRTALPGADFAPFRPEFRSDPDSVGRWKAFQRRLGIEQVLTFEEILAKLNVFAEPPLTAARGDSQFEAQWPAGGPWITR